MSVNPHLKSFADMLDERYPDDNQKLSYTHYLVKHTTLRSKPFSIKGYEFQEEIIDDMHPELCCIKPSQVGLTEVQIRKFFAFLKRNPGTSGIFSFPNQPMRDRISQTRIKLLLETDPIWNGPLVAKPTRQRAIYQVDESFGFITGTTEGEATSIAADILMEDEVDLADPIMRGLMQSRLQNSDWKITQKFSTPKYEGYGIDAAFNISDRREYFFKCGSCNHWQIPDFQREHLLLPGLPLKCDDVTMLSQEDTDKIVMDDTRVICNKCQAPLNLKDPEFKREWVAAKPGVSRRGYRVRPFSTHKITIPYILRQQLTQARADNRRGFVNTVLGRPFEDKLARLSEADIRSCFDSAPPPSPQLYAGYGDIFIGIDVGQTCHVVLGRPNHIFEWSQVPQAQIVDFVKGRCARYGIVGGGMDMYPYTPTAEQIRAATNGIVMPIAYATTPTAPAVKEHKDEFEETTHYVVNRTKALDAVAGKVRTQTWKFTGYEHQTSLIVTHLRDMIRIEGEDQPPVWNEINGDDHYLHALSNLQTAVRLKAGIEFTTDQRTSSFLGAGAPLFGSPQHGIYRGADTPFGVLG